MWRQDAVQRSSKGDDAQCRRDRKDRGCRRTLFCQSRGRNPKIPSASLGSETAEKLFPKGDALGQTIKIDGRTFKVVGVGKASVRPRSNLDMYALPALDLLVDLRNPPTITASVISTSPATYDLKIDEARTLMRVRRNSNRARRIISGSSRRARSTDLRDKIFERSRSPRSA
ncbi:MAG: ABC transporter permease [Acidobacteria bacterium]|nr:ABC transporter permease [Acidobacteriota bacterium]